MKRFLLGLAAGVVLSLVLALLAGVLVVGLPGGAPEEAPPVVADSAGPVEAEAALAAHSAEFARRELEVVPGVHVAIGYGLANVIVIEAPDGLIVVDTLESIRAANGLLPWLRGLRRRSGKDVAHIIYSHNHADHVFGAGVIAGDQPEPPQVWAQAGTAERVHAVVSVLRPVIYRRSMRQFGVFLDDDALVNAGIGPRLKSDHRGGVFYLEPDHVFARPDERLTMAGERLRVLHAPGETNDQLAIYLPDRGVLLPADNYYHAFPNLYAIRGTPYRDPRLWASSIDAMLALAPQVMIPQHGGPVAGAGVIRERLTNYRDAIQFVHDQTIRLINRGLTPLEIAETIKLPPHLAGQPYLQEFYGRVDWAARAVFAGQLGWFSGDPVELNPVFPGREATLMAELAGGPEALAAAARAALDRDEANWALALAGHLQRLGAPGASALRAEALIRLGAAERSATGRNYFLTAAAEARGFGMPKSTAAEAPVEMFAAFPIRNYLTAMQVALKAEQVLGLEMAIGFAFADTDERYSLRIRRGVAVLETGLAPDRTATLRTDTMTLKQILAGRLQPARAVLSGALAVNGEIGDFIRFLGHFERDGES